MITPDEVLEYWFSDAGSTPKIQRWFSGGPAVDAEIRGRFGSAVEDAVAGKLDGWCDEPRSCLALVLLLDQMTRNVYRDDPKTYGGDLKAQGIAVDALDRGWDRAMPLEQAMFLSMPLLHAEDVALQRRSVAITRARFERAEGEARQMLAANLEQAEKYLGIIEKFGRFPHRNALLGRVSSADEVEFLKDWDAKRAPKASQ